ncbi:hypothetical protein MPTK1_7g13680 [Marchantia polymorpha subsp. ruderalis]|uniref:Uncharacterized protein n=2 Tax=Marchantia polymorpha TaxID=3197 RepID=A0AAF6BZ95_MARPO|nr:hypothetical protein MARPO_0009s0053 [Marchantia polymorpha]PTQ46934.1 hypothetical protein MARPO_0009s0053 [Marchantia polymorpha]BBN17329.1 hypothetical protein Mp_7g13680 [Marchantia polymorpha subsp. ruderalis]BBN17330.1 hypothetical protein Mp_7g13680 [Marchantia polymorpha subsp. ruderalis]|eukprot:PTQ46933.1 hypothetical protein MARPO_0009s0053 [Marchantia polymorpha]
MKRNYEAIKRKFYSPLMTQRASLTSMREESSLSKLNEESCTSEPDTLEFANTISSSQPQGPESINACTQSRVSAPESGENGSRETESPKFLSQLGKRAVVRPLFQKPQRQSKLQRTTLTAGQKLTVSHTEDVLQQFEDTLMHPVTPTSSKEKPFLEIIPSSSIPNIEYLKIGNESSYSTTLVSNLAGLVQKLQKPSEQALQVKKDVVRKLQILLVPRACPRALGESSGVSKHFTSVILTILGNPKTGNHADRKFTKEDNMSTEWEGAFSSKHPLTRTAKNCMLVLKEKNSEESLYETQTSEFRGIWSSKNLQLAEVSACMMQSDFEFLTLIQ